LHHFFALIFSHWYIQIFNYFFVLIGLGIFLVIKSKTYVFKKCGGKKLLLQPFQELLDLKKVACNALLNMGKNIFAIFKI
jgi:hypothetical protein